MQKKIAAKLEPRVLRVFQMGNLPLDLQIVPESSKTFNRSILKSLKSLKKCSKVFKWQTISLAAGSNGHFFSDFPA